MATTAPIVKMIDNLPTGDVTVRMLQALDFIVPGEWQPVRGFDAMIQHVTNETDPQLIALVRQHAINLYNDNSQGYQRAIWLYNTVDKADAALAAAALANQVGNKIGFLGFLKNITPKTTDAQYADFAIKLVAEVVGFCTINGLPGDSLGDFVKSLTSYRHEALMRMGTLIGVDGVLSLGPDFLDRTLRGLAEMGERTMESFPVYKEMAPVIPGKDTGEKMGFMQRSINDTADWITSLVQRAGLTPEKMTDSLGSILDFSKQSAELVAPFIDLTTNYFTLTGTQTTARQIINRAIAEV
jgi:hypothetical protein